jgi:hypothetical protein
MTPEERFERIETAIAEIREIQRQTEAMLVETERILRGGGNGKKPQ